MKGITFLGDERIAILDFPDPVPGPHDVVLEIKASGMCGSDMVPYRRDTSAPLSAREALTASTEPVIAGHEPCGVVVDVGAEVTERQARLGMRAMVYHYDGCGTCAECRTGWHQLCTEQPILVYGGKAHGGHARYMRVPAHILVPLPDEVSYETGAAIACGTGTAFSGLRRLDLRADHAIAVFGQGPVGLAGTMLALAYNAHVIAIDVSEERLTMARDAGAHATINPAAIDDVVGAIRELTQGRGVHRALEASGSPIARVQAAQAVRTWGKVCYVGEGRDVTLDVSNDLCRRQVEVIGHWTFSSVWQGECARFIADKGVAIDRMITDHFRLDQAEEAYRRLSRNELLGKGVFLPDQD